MNDCVTIPIVESTRHDERTFPSGFRSTVGLRVVEWEKDRCVVEIMVAPHLTNFAGVISGGAVSSAIDMAATLAGCWTPEPSPPLKAVTVSLAVAFISGTSEGVIRAVAIKQGGGKKIFASTVTVTSELGNVLATGQATLRYVA